MGKHRHSQDTLHPKRSELFEKTEKKSQGGPRVSFEICRLSLMPWQSPVCSEDGYIFDLVAIAEHLKEDQTHPITGKPLKLEDLVSLNFARNSRGRFECPLSAKEFTDFTKIAAIKTTGNVYAFDVLETLCLRPGVLKDPLNDKDFILKDVIILQDPAAPRAIETLAPKRSISKKPSTQETMLTKLILEEARKEKIPEGLNLYKRVKTETLVKPLTSESVLTPLGFEEFMEERLALKDWPLGFGSTESEALTSFSKNEIFKKICDHIKSFAMPCKVSLLSDSNPFSIQLFSDKVPRTVYSFLLLLAEKKPLVFIPSSDRSRLVLKASPEKSSFQFLDISQKVPSSKPGLLCIAKSGRIDSLSICLTPLSDPDSIVFGCFDIPPKEPRPLTFSKADVLIDPFVQVGQLIRQKIFALSQKKTN